MKMASAADKKNSQSAPTLEEIELQPASLDIWDKKYRLKTMKGDPVDADIQATYDRVARALAEVEKSKALQQAWGEKFVWAKIETPPGDGIRRKQQQTPQKQLKSLAA